MYKSIEDVPLHCFANKECTITPSVELKKYLRWMLDKHPDDLEYLWRHTQKYIRHGGCYEMTFDYWKRKLNKDLNKEY